MNASTAVARLAIALLVAIGTTTFAQAPLPVEGEVHRHTWMWGARYRASWTR